MQSIGAYCCEIMYFWCFGFRGELGFLNCDDVCMCVLNKQFELLEFVSESVYVALQYDEISLTFTAGSECLGGVSRIGFGLYPYIDNDLRAKLLVACLITPALWLNFSDSRNILIKHFGLLLKGRTLDSIGHDLLKKYNVICLLWMIRYISLLTNIFT